MTKKRSTIIQLSFFVLAVIFSLLAWQLGQWQTSRAQEKIETQRLITKQSNMALTEFTEKAVASIQNGNINDWLYRPLAITGMYLEHETIYVDNVINNGRPGVTVLTPLLMPVSGEVVLIERGWLNWTDRNTAPALVSVNNETLTLTGRFKPISQSNSYINNVVNPAMPNLVLELSDEVIFQQFGSLDNSMVPAIFVLDTSQDNLDIMPWLIKDDNWISRHKGYAFQWIIIGLLIWTVYIVMLYRYIRSKNKQDKLP